jgi:hypothetical protein
VEGIVIDLGHQTCPWQQLDHDPPLATSYPVSDWIGVWHIDVRHDLTCPRFRNRSVRVEHVGKHAQDV